MNQLEIYRLVYFKDYTQYDWSKVEELYKKIYKSFYNQIPIDIATEVISQLIGNKYE